MKKFIWLLVIIFFISCSNGKKNLIVYYSQTGNTEILALEIYKHTNADTLSLKLENEYPQDFQETIARCKQEKENNIFPSLGNGKIELEKYDTIYLGYPIWFGTFARPIYTFINDNNNKLSGHVIVPFATYGRGGLINSTKELKDLCPEAIVENGLGISSSLLDRVSILVDYYFSNSDSLCGGYTLQHEVTENEKNLFNEVVDKESGIKPFAVSTQVVAGTNYIFQCKDSSDVYTEVKIFQPLEGKANIVSIEKQ